MHRNNTFIKDKMMLTTQEQPLGSVALFFECGNVQKVYPKNIAYSRSISKPTFEFMTHLTTNVLTNHGL
jgi:hypothetical protein